MTLACARLGCTEHAHSVLVFEPGSAAAWLMHAVEAHRTQGILLCRVHADVVTVPLGWNLVDERDPTWEPVGVNDTSTPEPEPEATAAAKSVPEPPFGEADVVEITSATVDIEPAEDQPVVAHDESAEDEGEEAGDDGSFEEVAAAQWTEPTESTESDDEVGTPTLFAVDDDDDPPDDTVDTPLLNRAFRAAQRY